MKKQQRMVADKTRLIILNAAKTVFLKKGFEGSSIIDIAKKAGVNKTLIFHHYKNKNTLWVKVKESIIENSMMPPQYDLSSAKAYFQSIIDYRFDLYVKNPDLSRLVAWQQLSDDHALLIGNDYCSPNHWLKDIRTLQKKGYIKKEIDAKLMMLFIIYSSYAPFSQNVIVLNKKQCEQYKKILTESCMAQFSNQ